VVARQTRSVLSSDGETMTLPDGEKAHLFIVSVWPDRVPKRLKLASVSQSLIVVSIELDKRSLLFGEKVQPRTGRVCPVSVFISAKVLLSKILKSYHLKRWQCTDHLVIYKNPKWILHVH